MNDYTHFRHLLLDLADPRIDIDDDHDRNRIGYHLEQNVEQGASRVLSLDEKRDIVQLYKTYCRRCQ